jgi:hypothetical protein
MFGGFRDGICNHGRGTFGIFLGFPAGEHYKKNHHGKQQVLHISDFA